MADRGRANRANDRTGLVTLVRDHRTNDSVFGHVGRITYISPHDDDNDDDNGRTIGTLVTNRVTEKTHTWAEVRPFQKWDGPLTSETPQLHAPPPVPPRQYMKWLLQTAPDVLTGIAGPAHGDAVELVREAELLRQPHARLPLLAHGEIADLRTSNRTFCRVLAMAAGPSGHALRIVRVLPQDWSWAASRNVVLGLSSISSSSNNNNNNNNNIDSVDQGYWCGGSGLAMQQIKFVADNPSKPMAQWLLAQTAGETLLFEPTLGPVRGVDHHHRRRCRRPSCLGPADAGPSRLAMDLKFRIPMSDTGGRMHCDVAFNPATGKLPPQLAIIDDGGNWTVWNITGGRHMRKAALSAVLHAKGSMGDGPGPGLPLASTYGLGHLNRILWLPSGSPGPGQEAEQSQTLLLGDATSVSLFDVAHQDGPVLRFNTAHSGSLDVIVDVQVSPANPAHLFVLTTVAVFWFDLSRSSHRFRPGVPRARHAQPLLLLSCPHLRNPTDRTMKLCLFAVDAQQHAQQHAQSTVAAVVYSIKHPDAAVFRFTQCGPGQATYEHQPLRFSFSSDGRNGKNNNKNSHDDAFRGQQTMLVLPAQSRLNAVSKVEEENFGRAYVRDGVAFFQVVSLQPDLSLQWALYSCSPPHASSSSSSSSGGAVVAPFPVANEKAEQRRRKARRTGIVDYFANRFVVPDDFDDGLLLLADEDADADDGLGGGGKEKSRPVPKPEPAASDSEASDTPTATRRRRTTKVEVYNMARLHRLLDGMLEEAAADAFECTDAPLRGGDGDGVPSPLDMIRQIVDLAAEHGSFAYTTLLNIASAAYLRQFGADLTDLAWTGRLAELRAIDEQRVTIFNQLPLCGAGLGGSSSGSGSGPTTLYEALGSLCAISTARDDCDRYSDDRFVRRQGLLAYTAVRLFFSQISMVVMPRQVVYSGDSVRGDSVRGDSTNTTPVPEAPSLRHELLSSSPTKPSVPGWLLSSSQEYGGDEANDILPSMEIDDGPLPDGDGNVNAVDIPAEVEATEEEDPAIARLRQFAKTIKSEPPRADGELRLLTHWALGSDPDTFHWVPLGAAGEAEEELRRQAQEAREKKQRKAARRAARDRERLQLMSSQLPSQMSSQLSSQLPNHFYNSQATQHQQQQQDSPAIMSSQVFSSQVLPSSQPVIHSGAAFAKRPKKKKKPTTARGFK